MNWCDQSDEDELLPFALYLNRILHTIKVGEQMKQDLSDSGLSLYYNLIDSQTILVTHSPLTINEENLCDYTELKSKTESVGT